MDMVSRRSLFKGIGSLLLTSQIQKLPLSALTIPPTMCNGKSLQCLNVFLHGSFACIYDTTDPTGDIQVIMPDVGSTHVYTAGDIALSTAKQLTKGASYGTTGINKALMDPLGANVAVIEKSKAGFAIDPNNATFCKVTLPHPDAIWALNCRYQVDATSGQQIPWFSKYPHAQQPDALPLTLALSYSDFSDCPSFGETGKQPLWTASPRSNGGSSLHIRLELAPGQCPPPVANHFAALLDLLPPLKNKLQLNNIGKEKTAVYGKPPCMEKGEDQALLAILAARNTQGTDKSKNHSLCPETDQVSTCQSIIIHRP